MPNRDIWDSITIIVVTGTLYKEFDHVISRLLGQEGIKSVAEIQSLLLSAKAKFLSKKAARIIADLLYISRNSSHKRKAISKDKCFNYHKMRHYGREYKYLNFRLLKKK